MKYAIAIITTLLLSYTANAQCFSTAYVDPGVPYTSGTFTVATGNQLFSVYQPTNFGLVGGFSYGNAFGFNRFAFSPFYGNAFYGTGFHGGLHRNNVAVVVNANRNVNVRVRVR